jgi:hypothetical protein
MCVLAYNLILDRIVICPARKVNSIKHKGGCAMRTYENLGKPLQIGKLTIKNLFCMAPLGGSQHHLLSSGLKDTTIQ